MFDYDIITFMGPRFELGVIGDEMLQYRAKLSFLTNTLEPSNKLPAATLPMALCQAAAAEPAATPDAVNPTADSIWGAISANANSYCNHNEEHYKESTPHSR